MSRDLEMPNLSYSNMASNVLGYLGSNEQPLATSRLTYGWSPPKTVGSKEFCKLETAKEESVSEKKTVTRVVRVYIADPDPRVPLEKRVLYRGEEVTTEDTDQELFYSIFTKELLEKHNQERERTLDKEASIKAGKNVYLEPTRIRNLSMTVVQIAVF